VIVIPAARQPPMATRAGTGENGGNRRVLISQP
jgi:hypothetical protein